MLPPLTGLESLLPNSLEVDATLFVSKESKSINRITITTIIGEWELIPSILSIAQATCKYKVFEPVNDASVSLQLDAVATVGKSINLICKAYYPAGYFYLGLDESTPIYLNNLIAAFTSDKLGFVEELAITQLNGEYNKHSGYLAFNIAIAKSTNLKASDSFGFQLNNISLSISGNATYSFKMAASFTYTFTKAASKTLLFNGSAVYSGGWVFSLQEAGDVSLKDIATEFGFDGVPNALDAFHFTQLSMVVDVANNTQYFNGSGVLHLFGEDLNIDISISKIGTTVDFSGKFKLTIDGKDQDFSIISIKMIMTPINLS